MDEPLPPSLAGRHRGRPSFRAGDWRLSLHPPRQRTQGWTGEALRFAPIFMLVDKYRLLVFAAGSTVLVLRDSKGKDFVQMSAASPEAGSILRSRDPAAGAIGLELPDGWKLGNESFLERTTVQLPHPARACFFANESFLERATVQLSHPARACFFANESFLERATVQLSHPARACFFANGVSFQGPVDTFRAEQGA